MTAELRERIRERVRASRYHDQLRARYRFGGAAAIVATAMKRGEVVRPDVCSACGATGTAIHGHHDDYNKPLDLRWLCRSCHRRWHQEHSAILHHGYAEAAPILDEEIARGDWNRPRSPRRPAEPVPPLATTSNHAGKRLKTWLDTEAVSVSTLAAQLGVIRQSVYRWRRGERPPYEMMLKIQATTGITLAEWGLR